MMEKTQILFVNILLLLLFLSLHQQPLGPNRFPAIYDLDF